MGVARILSALLVAKPCHLRPRYRAGPGTSVWMSPPEDELPGDTSQATECRTYFTRPLHVWGRRRGIFKAVRLRGAFITGGELQQKQQQVVDISSRAWVKPAPGRPVAILTSCCRYLRETTQSFS